jgi:hypothetical protein
MHPDGERGLVKEDKIEMAGEDSPAFLVQDCLTMRMNYRITGLTLCRPLRGPGIPLADLARMFAPNHLDNLVQFLQKA